MSEDKMKLIEKELGIESPSVSREQVQAAYALNLCSVSVSQIIDYNDIKDKLPRQEAQETEQAMEVLKNEQPTEASSDVVA